MIRYDEPEIVELNDSRYLLGFRPTPYETILKQVRESIAEDQEGKMRRALIELGWTPPENTGRTESVKRPVKRVSADPGTTR